MRRRSALALRALLFLLSFMVLQFGWQALRGSSVERAIVHDGIVVPAAFLVSVFTPAIGARAVDFTLQAPGGGLNIQNGCEGLEVLFLLCAAFFVAPLEWRSRLSGLLLGGVVVFVINQARILLLFYAYRADRTLFDPLHSAVTPIAMVLMVYAYLYAWIFHRGGRTAATA